ncbi:MULTISPECIES: SRPBCC family protein [Paraburkholderia]|uniref:SRPBCC family protein n=1 Tax=Paraburkholderia metrosideri TaxID=580937 RepID=A0ABW9E469_9BURK
MSSSNPSPAVFWPKKYRPETAHIYARNEITIPAKPETIWAWLIRADLWPTWYPDADKVKFTMWPGPNLRIGSKFRWNTFGLRLTSTVHEFEVASRLSWVGRGSGINAFHGWVLTPLPDGTTNVVTEETQIDWMALVAGKEMQKALFDKHEIWLKELSRKAQSGLPE